MNIGLIENTSIICDVLTRALQLAGHHVHTYQTMQAFLAERTAPSWGRECPDLIIVDLVHSEDRREREQLACVRKDFPSLAVIVLIPLSRRAGDTALAPLTDIHILEKPFTFAQLLAAVERTKPLSSSDFH